MSTDGIISEGELWSFSVADYLVVDDMETNEAMWDIWWDGWGDPNNGAEVWFPESNIVHGGEQAMYLIYDNTSAPVSQVMRVWEDPQDWTRNSTETLSLWLHGDADNTPEPLHIMLGDSAENMAMVAHPDPALFVSDTWQQCSFPLADFAGIDLAEINSMVIVLGDSAAEESGMGTVFIDDICLLPASAQGQ